MFVISLVQLNHPKKNTYSIVCCVQHVPGCLDLLFHGSLLDDED